LSPEKAQALVDLAGMGPGKVLIAHVAEQLEKVTKSLYYAPGAEVQAYQGQARGYYEVLKLFEDAKKVVNS
jgi:hypothetical protein